VCVCVCVFCMHFFFFLFVCVLVCSFLSLSLFELLNSPTPPRRAPPRPAPPRPTSTHSLSLSLSLCLSPSLPLPLTLHSTDLKFGESVHQSDFVSALAHPEFSAVTSTNEFELYVTCSICSNGSVLGLPASTSYKCFRNVKDVRWDEWLTFPVKYRDLPAKSTLVFTVWNVGSRPDDPLSGSLRPIGGTTMPMFNRKGLLKLGARQLLLWPNQCGDTSELPTTPYKAWKARGPERLNKTIRSLDQRELPKIKWLDGLAIHRMQKLFTTDTDGSMDEFLFGSVPQSTYEPPTMPSVRMDAKGVAVSPVDSFFAEFTQPANTDRQRVGVDVAAALAELPPDSIPHPDDKNNMFLGVSFPPFETPIVFYHSSAVAPQAPSVSVLSDTKQLYMITDPDTSNLVMNKIENPMEHKYHKLARASQGFADRDLKPKVQERKQLLEIVSSPVKDLKPKDRQLLWRFRYSLLDNAKALNKFLRAVDWSDMVDTKEAVDELLPKWKQIDIADALDLLSAYFVQPKVREYAVQQLTRADNDELLSYLLQLVQALRYEPGYPSVLSEFLIRRCTETLNLANFFHWYLMVERSDQNLGPRFKAVHEEFLTRLETLQDEKQCPWLGYMQQQSKLIDNLIELGQRANEVNGRVKQKIERMRELLGNGGEMHHLRHFAEPVRMIVRPDVTVTGLLGEKCTMFKSALAPILGCFTTQGSQDLYRVIFKCGDDLRQDQLMLQMISLMDRLMKKFNLDLRLTPYQVLATSPEDGFVEFVPDSRTLTSILQDYDKNIGSFFEKHNPKRPQLQKTLDNFVKSCAGYCVITYILGIGDRHLDNLLLTTDGHLFHIDFGYIFGRDPKPFPPPMKLCKEMVEAMGGAQSESYQNFRKYCCLAFNILRKHANLILNLLSLMGDSDIPDLCLDLDKNLLKVQEKFRLDLNDEQAERFLLSLVDESVSALFPQIVEKIHKWALYWK
jgi:phosphatidylinositol 3-kinase